MLGVAGCAQAPQPQQLAAGHGKEYFPSSVYGPASRRVVADGQPIPHGGGQYLVGKPYTVAGQTYYPSERAVHQVGLASWYGDAFHGRLTANGEVYDRDGFTAAHPTMPLPSYARVTNLRNNYSMVVRVNDRGPYHAGRVMDVSRGVAEALDFQRGGTAKIRVEYVGRASLAGSDNARLYATLRHDGGIGAEERSLVAETAEPRPSNRFASLLPFASSSRQDTEEETRRDRRDVGEGRVRPPERRERIAPLEPARPPQRAERPAAAAGDGGGRDRRRLADLVEVARREPGRAGPAGKRGRAGDEGRRDGREGRRDTIAEAILPPPRPSGHGSARGTGGWHAAEPLPPPRLRVASVEPARKNGGMRLTRPRGD